VEKAECFAHHQDHAALPAIEVTQQSIGRLVPKVAYKRVELTMELGA
jgi:hypothetical protein